MALCPYLRSVVRGRPELCAEDYCLASRQGVVRVPTIRERDLYCYTDDYVLCRAYQLRTEEEEASTWSGTPANGGKEAPR